MSPNRRHTTVGFTIAENEDGNHAHENASTRKRRGSLQDIEQAELDMDNNLLAGTPMTPGNFMAGTGRVPGDEDDITVEL